MKLFDGEKKGATFLIAILILSVVMSVGLTLLNAVVKQFRITITAEESVLAFYAADAGVECALLWDIRGHEPAFYGFPVFATSSSHKFSSQFPVNPMDVHCAGTDLSGPGDYRWTHDFTGRPTTYFYMNYTNGTCSKVSVEKFDNGTNIETTIKSQGYNVPCDPATGSVGSHPRTVERALRVDYVF